MSHRSIESGFENLWALLFQSGGCVILLLASGCTADRAPPQASAPLSAPIATAPAQPATTPAMPSPHKADTHTPDASVAVANTLHAKTPTKATTSTAAAPQTPKAVLPAAPPAMDLQALKTQLRETSAIGTFTKLTLKNQVDDLLDQMRSYHEGQLKITLAELRQPFDRLILKVLALLQDKDTSLANMIARSREGLWNVLADPVKFKSLS